MVRPPDVWVRVCMRVYASYGLRKEVSVAEGRVRDTNGVSRSHVMCVTERTGHRIVLPAPAWSNEHLLAEGQTAFQAKHIWPGCQ